MSASPHARLETGCADILSQINAADELNADRVKAAVKLVTGWAKRGNAQRLSDCIMTLAELGLARRHLTVVLSFLWQSTRPGADVHLMLCKASALTYMEMTEADDDDDDGDDDDAE
jgi:hypothetical protein